MPEFIPHTERRVLRRCRRRPSADRLRRRRDPPRRRQRGRRRAGVDARIVRHRAAADRARSGRLHARRPARRRAGRCLDFFVEASGRGADLAARESLLAVDVSFGDVVQVFHIGAASCGTYGTPAGVCAAADRFGTVPLAELTAPAVALAREGVRVNSEQAYVYEILAPIYSSTAECRALFMPEGRVPHEGDVLRDPEMADSLERLGAEGAAPFYSGDIGAAISDRVCRLGGTLTREDLAAYEAVPREPVRVRYHGREVLTNPPPSAGGTLLAYALALLAARVRSARRGGARGGDGARPGRAHARVPDRPRRARLPRPLHGQPARLDNAHLGDRRRRLGVLGHVHERRGLGRRGARHRRARQQHDGRAGPLAARLLHAPAGAAAARR